MYSTIKYRILNIATKDLYFQAGLQDCKFVFHIPSPIYYTNFLFATWHGYYFLDLLKIPSVHFSYIYKLALTFTTKHISELLNGDNYAKAMVNVVQNWSMNFNNLPYPQERILRSKILSPWTHLMASHF